MSSQNVLEFLANGEGGILYVLLLKFLIPWRRGLPRGGGVVGSGWMDMNLLT